MGESSLFKFTQLLLKKWNKTGQGSVSWLDIRKLWSNRMKKSLIALAVLATTGAAMAQSSVTLSGRVDAALYSETTGGICWQWCQSRSLLGSHKQLSEDQ